MGQLLVKGVEVETLNEDEFRKAVERRLMAPKMKLTELVKGTTSYTWRATLLNMGHEPLRQRIRASNSYGNMLASSFSAPRRVIESNPTLSRSAAGLTGGTNVFTQFQLLGDDDLVLSQLIFAFTLPTS